jgi:hypothetical protein
MFLFFQYALVTAIATYLWLCQSGMRRRNRESWQNLSEQLELWSPERATPWSRFQRARVVLEMTDYLCSQNSQECDLQHLEAIAEIRKHAMEDRLAALFSLGKN